MVRPCLPRCSHGLPRGYQSLRCFSRADRAVVRLEARESRVALSHGRWFRFARKEFPPVLRSNTLFPLRVGMGRWKQPRPPKSPFGLSSYHTACRPCARPPRARGIKDRGMALMRCITESLYCSCGSSLPFILASLVLAPLALAQLVSLTSNCLF
jgi:hypothetical protein